MEKGRSKYSLYNALSAVGLTLVNGLLGIVVTKQVISYYGSDFNGLNSTANQIVNVLLLLEGGFTLASNVALFAPLSQQDYKVINGILEATRKKFRRIGILFLFVGIVLAILYAFIVNSGLTKGLIVSVIVMTVVPQAFNLFYTSTYRVLLQAQQKEYIANVFSIVTIGMGHIVNLIVIALEGKMWMIRMSVMVFAFINSILISVFVRRENNYVDFCVRERNDLIKGTKDVLIQKITGVIYNSAPIVFLSISPAGGTMLASVYALYNSIFIMIKSLIHAFIDAPRLGMGQLLSEKKRDDVWEVYKQYEYLAFIIIFIFMVTTCILVLPFIKIYSVGITDIEYYDKSIAVLMILISAIEMLHIPSGHLINMAGEFKISKRYQSIACILLIVTVFMGGNIYGIRGMLMGILVTAVVLAILEMKYIHTVFFVGKSSELLKMLLPLLIVGTLICVIALNVDFQIRNYIEFIIYGVIFFGVNGIISVVITVLFSNKLFLSLYGRVKKY